MYKSNKYFEKINKQTLVFYVLHVDEDIVLMQASVNEHFSAEANPDTYRLKVDSNTCVYIPWWNKESISRRLNLGFRLLLETLVNLGAIYNKFAYFAIPMYLVYIMKDELQAQNQESTPTYYKYKGTLGNSSGIRGVDKNDEEGYIKFNSIYPVNETKEIHVSLPDIPYKSIFGDDIIYFLKNNFNSKIVPIIESKADLGQALKIAKECDSFVLSPNILTLPDVHPLVEYDDHFEILKRSLVSTRFHQQ